METQKKSVPDVECLKYHGTPGKPDIKIFVSHRIDLDSETIDNPLYIPVRCGAVYDERQGVTMLGDDTGDNISEKRNSFCELTVQYWAWKNIDADYYGMCQYRRYLSFSEDEYPMDASYVHERYITKDVISRHKLLESVMRTEIEKYDVLFAVPTDILRTVGAPESNYDLYKIRPQDFDGTKPVDLLISIIKEKYPEYAPDVENYFSASSSTFYNCYVMKKEIFHDYNQWLFDILFEFEKQLDVSNYNIHRLRAPAFMSEPLFGIYFMHQQRMNSLNVSYPHQIVFFERPERVSSLSPAFGLSNVAIVIPSSNYYAPYAAVCLRSILSHITPQHNYDFIFLSSDISEQNKRILKSFENSWKNVSIRFYNPEPLVYKCKNDLFVSAGLDLITCYRVVMPYALKNYKKVICIDSDLIFETDIADLFEIDIEGKYLAAVKDAVWQGMVRVDASFKEYCNNKYHLNCPENYVNTGVAVYNLELLRKRYSLDEILRISTKQKYRIQEQDVINLLVEEQCLFLDDRWNVYTCDSPGPKISLEYAPAADRERYWSSRKMPFVIHWASIFKPWVKPDCDFADRFWYYARMSPLYEIILHRMMWDVRNIPTPPVPPPPYRSKARKLADKVLPKGTRRRNLAKKILPKGSKRWNFCKKIYYKIFRR